MVARLLRLRVTLLLSTFRTPASVVIRRLIGGGLAMFAAIALAWLPSWAAQSAADVYDLDTVLLSLVLGSALMVPLFANRGHLEARQFAQAPVNPGSVAIALLLSTVLSWPVLWLLSGLVALGLMRPSWEAPVWATSLAIALAVLFAISAARVSSGLAKLMVSRQAAGTVRAVGWLLIIAALPVGVFVVTQSLGDPGSTITSSTAETLGWLPFGAPISGIALAAAGDISGAWVRFGVAALAILLLLIAWYAITRRSLESVEKPLDRRVARSGLGWFERMPARAPWAIAARVLTYWARDPRYRVGLIAVPFVPLLMLGALWVAGVRHEALWLVPLPVILLMIGWSIHNDVAMDSTAIWSHIASGTRGRADRAGRLAPVLLLGLPLVLIGSSLTVTFMGDWRALPATLGMNLAVLFAACGVSSVFSTLMPYPTTRPGDSPFTSPSVSGAGSGTAQTLSMLFSIIFAVPPVIVAGFAFAEPTLQGNLIALVFGAFYGLALLTLGVLIGGRIFDRTGPELVAVMQTFD